MAWLDLNSLREVIRWMDERETWPTPATLRAVAEWLTAVCVDPKAPPAIPLGRDDLAWGQYRARIPGTAVDVTYGRTAEGEIEIFLLEEHADVDAWDRGDNLQ